MKEGWASFQSPKKQRRKIAESRLDAHHLKAGEKSLYWKNGRKKRTTTKKKCRHGPKKSLQEN